jgi:hypothetical protein
VKKKGYSIEKKIKIITIMKVVGYAFSKSFESRLIPNNYNENSMRIAQVLL